jgi:hypothetical protein
LILSSSFYPWISPELVGPAAAPFLSRRCNTCSGALAISFPRLHSRNIPSTRARLWSPLEHILQWRKLNSSAVTACHACGSGV